MNFPRFWWLLVVATLGQGIFFAGIGILRWRGKKLQKVPRPLFACFWAGACAGLSYGALQNDYVFALGQSFVIILFLLNYFRK